MWGFLKSSDAVIGPGGTVVLQLDDANISRHDAELILGSAGKEVKPPAIIGEMNLYSP